MREEVTAHTQKIACLTFKGNRPSFIKEFDFSLSHLVAKVTSE